MSRPLSVWVAYTDGDVLGPINEGEDRADARTLSDFDHGWRRVAVPWRGSGHVLGLNRGNTYAIELDSYGNPILVSPLAAESIAELERSWPHGRVDVSRLADESIALRYWLLARLDAEGEPEDAVFLLLPWDLLTRAVAAAERLLANESGELVELRHWFNPAAVGLTGPLEQLDHGLRTGDPDMAREGAQTLMVNLRDMPLRRIPATVRSQLAGLTRRLSFVDEDLAASVSARLTATDSDELSPAWFAARLVGSTYLSGPNKPSTATARLEFDSRDVRGTISLTSNGLVVTLTGVDMNLTVETPGGQPVTMVWRGRSLYAVLPWDSNLLPDHLIFREGGRR